MMANVEGICSWEAYHTLDCSSVDGKWLQCADECYFLPTGMNHLVAFCQHRQCTCILYTLLNTEGKWSDRDIKIFNMQVDV